MKNFISFFLNVKRILDDVQVLTSQMSRMTYILGELVQRIKMIEESNN